MNKFLRIAGRASANAGTKGVVNAGRAAVAGGKGLASLAKESPALAANAASYTKAASSTARSLMSAIKLIPTAKRNPEAGKLVLKKLSSVIGANIQRAAIKMPVKLAQASLAFSKGKKEFKAAGHEKMQEGLAAANAKNDTESSDSIQLQDKYSKKIDSRQDSLEKLEKDIDRKGKNLDAEQAKAEPKLEANAQKIADKKAELIDALTALKALKPTSGQ
jgi:hypothetical protein